MAFDPNMEDYLRLSLHYASSMAARNPYEAARAATTFATKYQTKRDSLEQTDADRAFWLVTRAADLIDYQLPFSEETEAAGIIEQAGNYLSEAIELDPECWDAHRMLSAAKQPSPNEYAHYLAEHAEEVRTSCLVRYGKLVIERDALKERSKRTGANQSKMAQDVEMLEMAMQLTLRPWLRWLAAQASIALICGRYSLSIAFAKEALSLDALDLADASFTLALAYAKLECAEELAALEASHPQTYGEAWFIFARLALAFKAGNLDAASAELQTLLETYPNAALPLGLQNDIPDGIYARILVEPGSEDELILAISEATVILQEGCDIHERGTLGSWIASHPLLEEAASK